MLGINSFNISTNFSAVGCTVKAFLCYKDGVLAGRIAGIIVEESNRKWKEKAIKFSSVNSLKESIVEYNTFL